MGHAVALMHEHQREDRDDFLIFHADRVTKDRDQYEKRDTIARTEKYDFKSLMHYPVGDSSNPYFESRTGTPIPKEIRFRTAR